MRELDYRETDRLEECLKELAAHHNAVSVFFPGQYPKKTFRETLESFARDVRSGKSRIGVVENGEKVLGFCKADINGTEGAVDYLIVLREARGNGYGEMLMDWALGFLKQEGAARIEVKVVDGNDAAGFYEKYGFRVCSHILRMNT